MRASSSQSAAALFAFATALAVLTAGCVAQDRPHEAEFFVVADAGESDVVTAGDQLHLHWDHNHTIETEGGETVHEEVEYEWRTSTHDHGNHSDFSFTPTQPGLVLVELNVTAANHTASDAAAVLVLPPTPASSGGSLYVATIGDIRLEAEGASAGSGHEVLLGEFEGEYDDFAVGSEQFHAFHIAFAEFTLEAEGTILFAVLTPAPSVRAHETPPLALDASANYTLVVDTSPAQAHRVLTRNDAGALVNNSSLADFESAHAAEHEVKVLVAPPGGKLPGFEGIAAASAVAIVSLVLVRRRH